MNQVYRIGDGVVIVRTARLYGVDAKGELELQFTDGREQLIGTAIMPREGVIQTGDEYLVTGIGTVVGAMYSFSKRQVEYQLMFETARGDMAGYAHVAEELIVQPSEQRLRQEDVVSLNKRGIPA